MSLELTPYDRLFQFKPEGAPNYALLREARAVIDAIPEAQLDLSQIITERGLDEFGSIADDGDLASGCGTIACAAGWLALTPRFQALGLTAVVENINGDEIAMLAYQGVSTENQASYDLATAPLFNITFTQAASLFATRGEHESDTNDPDEDATDKEIFLARIDALLAAETAAK